MSNEALNIHIEDLRELSEENEEVAEVVLEMMMEAEEEFGEEVTIE